MPKTKKPAAANVAVVLDSPVPPAEKKKEELSFIDIMGRVGIVAAIAMFIVSLIIILLN